MDFTRLKEIPFDEVLKLYGVQFTDTKGGLSSICPLPGHPQGERKKTFSVRLPENYFRCWSAKCNDASGGKRGGDVIAFVALMDGTNQGEAAKKLETHFFPSAPAARKEEGRPQIEDGRKEQIAPLRTGADGDNKPSAPVGKGYMAAMETTLRTLLTRKDGEDEETWWKRVLKGLKSELYKSYLAGKAVSSPGLPPQ